ncbi:MAG: diguanylate cyclase [Deltaproteobacteria bacterium]|nr:diguanylate cyclase [Myxococcales bacterium]MDP3213536.1 diguanylate cyclase [Deltaproteobacteria bacterium]
MELFVWDDHFVTGLGEVDRQHRCLVDAINAFGSVLAQADGAAFDALEQLFDEVVAYARYHFEDEDAQMMAAGVDMRHVAYHRREHANFFQEVTQMRASVTPQDLERARPLQEYLVHWLAHHILGCDQVLARQIAAIRSGQTPAEAYLAEERRKDGAVAPLVRALNGLFQQVTERNRELQRLNETLEARVGERTAALAIANRHLEELSLTDALTGLPNRRHAMMRLTKAWEASVRDGTPMACMMIDADGFKQVNDTHGHEAGDEVLRQLSRSLQHSIRTDDVVCRLGGDEFLVICERTPLGGAIQLAERMRTTVEAMRVAVGKGEWRGSVSIGAAVRDDAMQCVEDLMRAADEGVYLAKRSGRNRVAVAP